MSKDDFELFDDEQLPDSGDANEGAAIDSDAEDDKKVVLRRKIEELLEKKRYEDRYGVDIDADEDSTAGEGKKSKEKSKKKK
ncbi:MAG: hypothetical protein JSS53_04945 [Proteobacteria bacterium]|nr:hypothetical protein [Pseudomonadota bacterium]